MPKQQNNLLSDGEKKKKDSNYPSATNQKQILTLFVKHLICY